MKIMLINGPNLNLLGQREVDIYGSKTLNEIENNLKNIANQENAELICFQSNSEGEMIDQVHDALDLDVQFILINPAAYTHTSIALRDAFLSTSIPFYEVHITDINDREDFRKISYLKDIAQKSFIGHGVKGCLLYTSPSPRDLDLSRMPSSA